MKKKYFYLPPQLLLIPATLLSLIFVYGLTIWTFVLSLTKSSFLPIYKFAGFKQYIKLFGMDRFQNAYLNLVLFVALAVGIVLVLGTIVSFLLYQKIRWEGFFKSLFLYPMALSFIVAGTSWRWLLNGESGIARFLNEVFSLGIEFDWLNDPERSLFAIILTFAWQSSGLAIVMLLAHLKSIDKDIIKAAMLEGVSKFQLYSKIIFPQLKYTYFTISIILTQSAVKTFEVVLTLTNGGPGFASDLPSTFMYDYSFNRGQLGLGAASAICLLITAFIFALPQIINQGKEHV